MSRSRQIAVATLFVSFGWALAGGCSSSGNNPSNGASGGTGGSIGGTPGNPMMVPTSGTTNGGGGSADQLNPLCGVSDAAISCIPDLDSTCRTYEPPATGDGGAGGQSSGAAGQAGQSASGGDAPNAGGEGGATAGSANMTDGGDGGDGGAGTALGGEGGQPNTSPQAKYSCQVTRQNNQLSRQCVLAGVGKASAPCFSAADCAPGLACVTDGDAGRCLPYCCDPHTECGPTTYCAERPLRKALSDTSNAEPPHVPVCVPADGCSLEEQFPCPAGAECRCQGNTACMVVRHDGTTTCLEPGMGVQGEACPCAWNHVCSSVTDKCVKICRTDPSKNDCGDQKCQASSELPPNFGVCVGPIK
jgi:hypothetical protein